MSAAIKITHLPLEVISHIFRFIPHSDLKQARLVCKRFYDASVDRFLLEGEKFVCRLRHDGDFQELFMNSNRRFINLEILDCWLPSLPDKPKNTIWSNKPFWSKFGPKLRSLTIGQCIVTRGAVDLLDALGCCTALKVLKVAYCTGGDKGIICVDLPPSQREVAFFPILRNLRTVIICLTPNVKWLFDILVLGASNINFLDLRGDLPVNAESYELTFKDVLEYVESVPDRIIELSLVLSVKSDFAAYQRLVALPNARIRCLEINYQMMTIPVEWIEFLKKQIWLRSLSLICVTNDHLIETVCGLPLLEELDATCAYEIFDGVAAVSSLQNLTCLRLVLCFKVRSEWFLRGLCHEVNSKLKELTLTVLELPEKIIVELARTHPALTYLNLTCCKGVTDRSVQAIFYHQVGLETLILDRCANFSDRGLKGERLASDDPNLEAQFPTGYPISRLKNLRKLSLEKCIINGSVFETGLRIPDLRSAVFNFTKLTENAIKCLVRNNRTIEYLAARCCRCFTDDLIQAVVDNLPRIRRLDISGCYKVTLSGISQYERRCADDMRLKFV